MKPFANITVSDDGNSWIVQVNDTAIDGNPFSGMSWEKKVVLINAAFESRLKEEMEKFKERVVQEVASYPTSKSLYVTWKEAESATEAKNEIVEDILCMPLFETEVKP